MKRHCLIILFVFTQTKITFGQCEQVLDGVYIKPAKVNKANIKVFNYRGEKVFLIDTLIDYYHIVLPKPIQDGRYLAFYDNDTANIAYDYGYKSGKTNGQCFLYFKSGQVNYSAEFSNGEFDGNVIFYFSSGQISSQGFYVKGKSNGKYLTYYNDGKKKSESDFKNGKQVYLREWDCEGKLTYDHVYKDYYKHE